MGDHHADPEEARPAPLDSSESWACFTSADDPRGPFVFLSDKDVSDGIWTHCEKHDLVADVARELYYGVKILKDLRGKVPKA